jgi:hypothetical protein
MGKVGYVLLIKPSDSREDAPSSFRRQLSVSLHAYRIMDCCDHWRTQGASGVDGISQKRQGRGSGGRVPQKLKRFCYKIGRVALLYCVRRGNFAPVVEVTTTTTDLLLVIISLLTINVSTDNTDNERYLI